jgi:hypothetical protein
MKSYVVLLVQPIKNWISGINILHIILNMYVCMVMMSVCYCLFSRLCQSCNHVAALLFRVEAAVRTGMTASTSHTSTWNIPSKGSIKLEMKPLADYEWKKDHLSKQSNYTTFCIHVSFSFMCYNKFQQHMQNTHSI